MSLQVCHCGWSKVTSYQGLRVHQGRMGCTAKGARVAESEQQYIYVNMGVTGIQKDTKLDVCTSFKTADYYSEMSIQVCHCGWTKLTTYQGLRIHQGKMGCTVKGMRIPERNQYDGKKPWKVDERDCWSDNRVTVKKENLLELAVTNVYTKSAALSSTTKEENKSPSATSRRPSKRATKPKGSPQLWDFSTLLMENESIREHPTLTAVEPQEKKKKQQTSKQKVDSGLMGNWYSDNYTDQATTRATIKEEPKSSFVTPQASFPKAKKSKSVHHLQDVSVYPQLDRLVREPPITPPPVVRPKVKSLVRERPTTTYPATAARPMEEYKEDQMLSKNVPLSPKTNSAAAVIIKEKPKSPCEIPEPFFQRGANLKLVRHLQVSTGPQVNGLTRECPQTPPQVIVQPQEKDGKDPTLSQVRRERTEPELQQEIQIREEKMINRAAERACEETSDSSAKTGMSSAAVAEVTAEENTKSFHESAGPGFSTAMKVKELAQMFSAATNQKTTVRPKEKQKSKLSQVQQQPHKFSANTALETAVQPKEKSQKMPNTTSATTPMTPTAAEAMTEEDPTPSCAISDFPTGMKVKKLVQMFTAATTQKTAAQPKEKPRKEPDTAQEERKDRITPDLKCNTQMREQKLDECRLSAREPFQGSLDASRMEIRSVFSEVMKVVRDAELKSLGLSLSTLRTATSTMMEQIQQKLSSLELKWISKFAVDVKLDPTTTQQCCVSADGKSVSDGGEKQDGCDPGRFSSVLGINRLTSGKSYWEVEVGTKTSWALGVARGDANRKGKFSLNPDNGYWVTVHYEGEQYAAMTALPVTLSLKEKPRKVGVFVDYEERLVSFYNVTAKSHIYSFTTCSFTGDIYPYFSTYLKDEGFSVDPLIISAVKHQ
ncbi:uncharacterized protein LOC113142615 isoform X2 [Mastacembelus armatus]|uniref:Uncharacterized LOC113142615 n=1 Tax=Mastacembelus armatus TaxID=205130 RepID=A0A7N8WXT4_9TELE|nr:uncharacterized protein LOC113142615 isoform X2 [Mastacembelus armatus]